MIIKSESETNVTEIKSFTFIGQSKCFLLSFDLYKGNKYNYGCIERKFQSTNHCRLILVRRKQICNVLTGRLLGPPKKKPQSFY